MAIGAKYYHSCINCGDINTDHRNEKGLPCEKCLPTEDTYNLLHDLEKFNTLKDYFFYSNFYSQYEEFLKFFEKKFGKPLTGYQRFWAKRLLLSKSFTMVAPTGIGKTTFGLISALWFARNNKKVALIFPTVSLVKQAEERLRKYSEGEPKDNIKILSYHSSMNSKDKEKFEKDFLEDNFDILVISSQFISRRRDIFSSKKFDLVFVDDVDAVLKSSKNIDTLLEMIGIPKELINEALTNIKLRKFGTLNNNRIENHGILIVSSATAKPRGIRPLLFRELLGFEIGRFVLSIRNIVNVRLNKKSKEKLLEIIRLLKDGVLLFVENEEEGEKLVDYLLENGIRVGKSWDNFMDSFERFKSGELDVLCGIYTYYGKLVRGIDLPIRIKYAVFWGTPCFRFSTDIDKAPRFVIERVLREKFEDNQKMSRFISNLSNIPIESLRESVHKFISSEEWDKYLRELFPNIKFENKEMVVPDVYTYIQASGRTSRMLEGRLTRGISILFEDDDIVFESLRSRLMFLTEEDWVSEEEIDWSKLIEEVEESRVLRGEPTIDNVKSILMIVESPTKADTISKFLEKADTRRYGKLLVHESLTPNSILLVTATKGHVYDLETKNGVYGVEVLDGKFIPRYNSIKRCLSCGYQFTDEEENCPKCNSNNIDDKKEILKTLRELALEVDEILVATDPDVEGEKISWDVFQYILPVNRNIKRIEMHEITRHGFESARKEERYVSESLVKSQVVRRIEDRWIGFELSGKLQKNFNSYNLSAGRVQSTVLGWIIEREAEYLKSEKEFTQIKFGNNFSLEIEGNIHEDKAEVKILDTLEETLSPLPPFTTSSILSESSRRYGYSVQEVTDILQDLFEYGLITYHRTDSTRISVTGQFVAKNYLEKVGRTDLFVGRSWESEGAHEAIRPVKPINERELADFISEKIAQEITKKHLNIYKLIFNRFLVSQMRNPIVRKQKILIKIDGREIISELIFDIKEDGWNIFYPISVYAPFSDGLYEFERRTYKKHTVPLYTQASIIEEMRNKEIGRPSTYSKIIDILFKRGYIIEDSYKRIRSTQLGRKVYTFLKNKYRDYIVEETTRDLEKLMEIVEKGEKDYQEVLSSLYSDLQKLMRE